MPDRRTSCESRADALMQRQARLTVWSLVIAWVIVIIAIVRLV